VPNIHPGKKYQNTPRTPSKLPRGFPNAFRGLKKGGYPAAGVGDENPIFTEIVNIFFKSVQNIRFSVEIAQWGAPCRFAIFFEIYNLSFTFMHCSLVVKRVLCRNRHAESYYYRSLGLTANYQKFCVIWVAP
jgi:hypothetical protein